MKTHVKWMVFAFLFIVAATSGRAQEKTSGTTPVKVDVVVSRYQGDKKVSSMPYSLALNVGTPKVPFEAGGVATLRMGARIPILMMKIAPVDGKEMPQSGPIQYQDVGTNIDCNVTAQEDGRFRVGVTIDDTSVYPDESGKTSDRPSFRSFRATNSLLLKDGQTGQFTTAVDKVSGEVTKVDVTLTVVK